jgi:hypothetical protein
MMSGNDLNPSSEGLGDYPKKDAESIGYDISEVALASVPLAGPALQKLVQSLGFDPFRKREQEFVQRLAEAVSELQQRKQIDVEALRDDPYFEGLINDIREKFKTARTEAKKGLLVDVAMTALTGISLDDALAGRFLQLLEQFSAGHVAMLKLLQNPSANANAKARVENMMAGGLSAMIEAAFQGGEIASNSIAVVYGDLQREGLVEGGFNVTMTGSGMLQRTNPLAREGAASRLARELRR